MMAAEIPPLQQRMQRIEELLLELEQAPESAARDAARELAQVLLQLHGDGLERLLAIADEQGDAGRILINRLGSDELVSSLLLLHGLHPVDFETRVQQALERVAPTLAAHGGSVELLGIGADRTIRLALKGSCHGCPSSRVTLASTIEEAIYDAAPETAGIELEGAAA